MVVYWSVDENAVNRSSHHFPLHVSQDEWPTVHQLHVCSSSTDHNSHKLQDSALLSFSFTVTTCGLITQSQPESHKNIGLLCTFDMRVEQCVDSFLLSLCLRYTGWVAVCVTLRSHLRQPQDGKNLLLQTVIATLSGLPCSFSSLARKARFCVS